MSSPGSNGAPCDDSWWMTVLSRQTCTDHIDHGLIFLSFSPLTLTSRPQQVALMAGRCRVNIKTDMLVKCSVHSNSFRHVPFKYFVGWIFLFGVWLTWNCQSFTSSFKNVIYTLDLSIKIRFHSCLPLSTIACLKLWANVIVFKYLIHPCPSCLGCGWCPDFKNKLINAHYATWINFHCFSLQKIWILPWVVVLLLAKVSIILLLNTHVWNHLLMSVLRLCSSHNVQ